jgi:hypothetical protein
MTYACSKARCFGARLEVMTKQINDRMGKTVEIQRKRMGKAPKKQRKRDTSDNRLIHEEVEFGSYREKSNLEKQY